MYTISKLCKEYNLSRSTLLYYDSIGLLTAFERTKSNYRLYSKEDKEKLEQICLYREAGVPLEHIKELLNANEKIVISISQLFEIKAAVPYMIALSLVGGSVACAVVFWQPLIQLNTPNNMTGRVFSVSTLVGNASLPIAYAIFGILLTYISIMKLMFFSGLCLILLCCFFNFQA